MTNYQALQFLKSAGIIRVRKEDHGSRLILTFTEENSERDVPLAQYKAALQEQVKGFDDQRLEIQKNTFAAKIVGEFRLGGGEPMKMEVLKKNEQLSREEKTEKLSRLMGIDNELKRVRGMLQVLSHLQIHAEELLMELDPRKRAEQSPAKPEVVLDERGRQIWARGVKSAALMCLAEAKKIQATDQATLAICRRFLDQFTISEEPDYTAEQLFNNLRQIRLLDSLDS